MPKINSFPTVLVFGVLFVLEQSVRAQVPVDTRLPLSLSSDSTALMNVVASYSDDVRQSVLRVSQYPEVLTRLSQQQVRSQVAFATLLQFYGQSKKGWFYDIARFPNALHALALLPRAHENKAQGRAITQTLPIESQQSAWKLYRHHHADLIRTDSINQQAEQLFDSLVTPLAISTQRSFRQLLTLPDLLELLTQQIVQTTRLGQSFQADSTVIVQQLISLHDSLTVQNQRELANYQRELSQDPVAQRELLLAGQDYARNNGRNMDMNSDPAWSDSSTYYQNPYSFWFSYPSWYTDPLWYPSLAWYGTGYGYGANGNLTIFGLPSPGFTNWFFTRRFRAYPHLCDRFNVYYDRVTGRHRIWTPRNSGFLLAAQRRFNTYSTDWNSHSNWLTRPRRYDQTGSNVNVWTSSPRRYYSRPSHSYQIRSWSHSSSHSSGSVHHSSSFHSGGSHTHGSGGGSHHSSGPR